MNLSLDEENLRRVAANYYNARPDHLKFNRAPAFTDLSRLMQGEMVALVRLVLEAAVQEES